MKIRIDPKKLRAARKAANLTQAALAEAIGMGWIQVTVSLLERGRETEVTTEALNALAQALHVAPDQLQAQGPASLPGASFILDPVRLKAARRAAGLTQQELSARSGFNQSSLSNLESGTTGASLEGVQVLASVLHVSVAYLLGGAEESPDSNLESVEAIRANANLPAGLRALAAAGTLIEELQIKPSEWKALAGLASSWSDAELTPRDGWVQILVSLRTAPTRRMKNC